MKKLSLFFRKIRQQFFEWRLDSEIYGQIFKQVNQEKEFDHPFDSREGLVKNMIRGELDAKLRMKILEEQGDQMPESYGEAFRYIMYRDLNERMLHYLKIAQRRIPPASRIPRFA